MARSNQSHPSAAKLLRMWCETTNHGRSVWRFSLEDVDTGKRTGFADLDALISHLLDLMNHAPDEPPDFR